MKTEYHAKYYAYDLTKQCSADSVEKFTGTLSEAQVQLNPHQVDAALFAFKSPYSYGAILADEVGLGKTIEAGIIISQYWAERKRKILVIMPSSLRKQWQQELEEKFFLPSEILETKTFNEQIQKRNLNPFQQDKIIICSYQFARNKAPYIEQVNWDLVVIDEAHRLRNVYRPQNKIANAIKKSIYGRKKILLTATPLQNSLLELYGLTSIIDDYAFGDLSSFKDKYCKHSNNINFKELKDRIAPFCQRTLRKQVLEYIKYTNRIAITEEFFPTEAEQRLYDGLSEYLSREKLYALPNSQRMLMTLILRRLLASSTYAVANTLGGLACKLQNIINTQKDSNENNEADLEENFETYNELKEEWIDEEDCDENEASTPKLYTSLEIEEIKKEKRLLESFYELAKSVDKNAKGEKLLTALERGFAENAKNGGLKKALIFTESTKTQMYLKEILDKTEYKGKIVLFNGSNSDVESKKIYADWFEKNKNTDKISGSITADKRAALVEHFKDNAEIMIATEAAAEGINLQFCSLIVNYDLPWNPQRIEQRIGRCHRYGQKNDVVVVNFLNKANEADIRVFQLLDEKFKLFSGVFGASDEVLGAIGTGIDFEKRIAEIYQNCRTKEEINRSFDDLQKEMAYEINEKIIDTRNKLFENFDLEVAQKLKVNRENTEKFLGIFEQELWDLTKIYLKDLANFSDSDKSFVLKERLFDNVNPGYYKLGKNINSYRIGHNLAQNIINEYKEKALKVKNVIFDYNSQRVSALKDFVGQSGWLLLKNLKVSALDVEDYILFAGYSQNGDILDAELCKKLFLLDAISEQEVFETPDIDKLHSIINVQRANLLEYITEKNDKFYQEEMDKIEKWAEDKENSLNIELKNIDEEIKLKRKEIRQTTNIQEKLKLQKEQISLERKRNTLRSDLYKSRDEITDQKEKMVDQAFEKLTQEIQEQDLFLIKWQLK